MSWHQTRGAKHLHKLPCSEGDGLLPIKATGSLHVLTSGFRPCLRLPAGLIPTVAFEDS